MVIVLDERREGSRTSQKKPAETTRQSYADEFEAV
jgi:hypothetical protein